MKTFKNSKFVERDYEATNVVFAKAEVSPAAHWVETTEEIPSNMSQLWIEGNTHFYGFL
jgi:hypothetical protein